VQRPRAERVESCQNQQKGEQKIVCKNACTACNNVSRHMKKKPHHKKMSHWILFSEPVCVLPKQQRAFVLLTP
jgi:hypothetical protein